MVRHDHAMSRRFALKEGIDAKKTKEGDKEDVGKYLSLLGLDESLLCSEMTSVVNLYPVLKLLQTCVQIQKVSPENKFCSSVQILDEITDNLESIAEENIATTFCAKKVINCIELIKFIELKLAPYFKSQGTSLLKSVLQPFFTCQSKSDA